MSIRMYGQRARLTYVEYDGLACVLSNGVGNANRGLVQIGIAFVCVGLIPAHDMELLASSIQIGLFTVSTCSLYPTLRYLSKSDFEHGSQGRPVMKQGNARLEVDGALRRDLAEKHTAHLLMRVFCCVQKRQSIRVCRHCNG